MKKVIIYIIVICIIFIVLTNNISANDKKVGNIIGESYGMVGMIRQEISIFWDILMD